MSYRVIAIATSLVEELKASGVGLYGHPAHEEVATGHGPCRHCLRAFRVGEERRILFTFDPFHQLEPLPLPGPVFVHADECRRYDESAGYPADLASLPVTLNGYGAGRRLLAQEWVDGGRAEAAVGRLLSRTDIDYIHVRDTSAGCYDFRIERS